MNHKKELLRSLWVGLKVQDLLPFFLLRGGKVGEFGGSGGLGFRV